MLQNFDTAVEATATAYNSAGSAAKENERSIDSLEGHTNNLKAAFQDLSNNVIPNELIKSLLDLATGFLNVANSGIGQFLIRFTLISTTVLGASTMFTQLAVKVLPMLKAAFVATAGGALTLQAALGWISLAAGAITAIVLATQELNKKLNETPTQKLEKIESNIKSLNDELSSNHARMKEIESMEWPDRTQDINMEYLALKQKNAELEQSIKLEKINATEQRNKILRGEDPSVLFGAAPSEYGIKTKGILSKWFDYEGAWLKKNGQKVRYATAEEAYAAGQEGNYTKFDVEEIKMGFSSMEELNGAMDEYIQKLKTGNSLTATENANLVNLLTSTAQRKEYLEDNNNLLMQGISTGYIQTQQDNEMIAKYDELFELYAKVSGENDKNVANTEKLSEKTNNVLEAFEKLGNIAPNISAALFDANGNMTDFATTALKGAGGAEKIAEALYEAALYSAKVREMMAEHDLSRYRVRPLWSIDEQTRQEISELERQIQSAQYEQQLIQSQKAQFISSFRNQYSSITGEGKGTGTGDTTKTLTQAEKNLQAFRSQLAYFEHELAMGEITEEQYYYHLHDLMNMYLQDAENVETLWKYQEKIYKHSQEELQNYYQEQLDQQNALIDKINERFDAEIDGLEKSNDELEKQIEYEQLLEDMASAKAKKLLVFKNGAFQYVEDVDAISSAQNALRKYYRQQEVEQKKQNIEAARQRELREPQQLVSRLEEIIKNIKGYATGTTYSAGGLSLVGEHGAELAVLSKGTGVIPADITKNLWAWGQTTPSALMSTVAGVNGQNGGIYFSGVTMSFPSVRNGNDAQSFMQSVVNLAYQRAYSRK